MDFPPPTKIDDILIYDNFLSPEYLDYLHQFYIYSGKVDYQVCLNSYQDSVTREDLYEDIFNCQVVKILCRLPQGVDDDFYTMTPFISVMPFMWRCKVNCIFPSETENKRMGIHTDLPQQDGYDRYYSAIMYLNDSDGPTEIKNMDTGEIVQVECKENRFIAFPGHFKHTGHTPTNVKSRFLINFVFFGNFHPDLMGQACRLPNFPWSPRNGSETEHRENWKWSPPGR